jgi:hypothetical protein
MTVAGGGMTDPRPFMWRSPDGLSEPIVLYPKWDPLGFRTYLFLCFQVAIVGWRWMPAVVLVMKKLGDTDFQWNTSGTDCIMRPNPYSGVCNCNRRLHGRSRTSRIAEYRRIRCGTHFVKLVIGEGQIECLYRMFHSGLASEDLWGRALGWTLHPIEKTFPIIITSKVFFQFVCG